MRCALTDAAFTKCREPSAQTSTLAKPGVKPEVWEMASTTGEPHLRSMKARRLGGRKAHSRRRAVLPTGAG